MKSPFRKLVRIAVVLLAGVLLFNFFGYYLIHLSSKQNEKMVQLVNVGGQQQTLGQIITKDVLLLPNILYLSRINNPFANNLLTPPIPLLPIISFSAIK